MAGVNLRFGGVSESEILEIRENATPENTKKVTKVGIKFLKVKGRVKRIKIL